MGGYSRIGGAPVAAAAPDLPSLPPTLPAVFWPYPHNPPRTPLPSLSPSAARIGAWAASAAAVVAAAWVAAVAVHVGGRCQNVNF